MLVLDSQHGTPQAEHIKECSHLLPVQIGSPLASTIEASVRWRPLRDAARYPSSVPKSGIGCLLQWRLSQSGHRELSTRPSDAVQLDWRLQGLVLDLGFRLWHCDTVESKGRPGERKNLSCQQSQLHLPARRLHHITISTAEAIFETMEHPFLQTRAQV
jgi:hypothetical protein